MAHANVPLSQHERVKAELGSQIRTLANSTGPTAMFHVANFRNDQVLAAGILKAAGYIRQGSVDPRTQITDYELVETNRAALKRVAEKSPWGLGRWIDKNLMAYLPGAITQVSVEEAAAQEAAERVWETAVEARRQAAQPADPAIEDHREPDPVVASADPPELSPEKPPATPTPKSPQEMYGVTRTISF